MPDARSTRRPEPADGAWAADPEIPDADADEQRRPVADDPEEVDPETAAGRNAQQRLEEPPLEVDEGDLAEQVVEIPFDDEVDRG